MERSATLVRRRTCRAQLAEPAARSSRPFDSRGATDVPSNPDEIYTKNWISWEDFLNGEYRDEEEQ